VAEFGGIGALQVAWMIKAYYEIMALSTPDRGSIAQLCSFYHGSTNACSIGFGLAEELW
jgi:hypothetical protein